MHLQKNWTRPVKIESENIDFRYYENYEPWPSEFNGELFQDAQCVLATTNIVKFTKKNGESSEAEVLKLAFVFKDRKHFFETQIWGARRDADGDWGDNPEILQDFLYICEKQLAGSTENQIERDGYYGKETVYPDICGQYFTLVIGKSGERISNGRTFDQNFVAIFAKNGFSALEIELGDKTPQAWKFAINKARKKFCEFKGIAYKPLYTEDSKTVATPAPATPQAVAQPAPTPVQAPATPLEPNPFVEKDDIPF